MKKNILLWLILLLGLGSEAWAQRTTIRSQSFESGETVNYTSNTFDLRGTTGVTLPNNQYFTVTTTNPPQNPADPSNYSFGFPAPDQVAIKNATGSANYSGNFWIAEGVRGSGTTDLRAAGNVTMNAINASGYTDIEVTVGLADARGPGSLAVSGAPTTPSGGSFQANDKIEIQYSTDNGTNWFTIGRFAGNNNNGSSGFMELDENLNNDVNDEVKATLNYKMTDFTFGNTAVSDIPGSPSSLIVRVVVDQRGASQELAFDNIRITGIPATGQAPTLDDANSGVVVNYTEGAQATIITNSIMPGSQSGTLDGATVAIISGLQSSEDVLSFTGIPNVITGSYLNGILTLTGTATVSQYQQVLQSVTYRNSNTITAKSGNRAVQFVVRSGSNSSSGVIRNVLVKSVLNGPASLPFTEDFTTDGEGLSYGSSSFVGVGGANSGIAFTRTNTNPFTTGQQVFTNVSNGFYWYGVNTISPQSPERLGRLETQQVDATNYGSLKFSIRLAAESGSGATWQNTDSFKMYYRTGGSSGTWKLFGSFRGTTTSINGTGDMKQDRTQDLDNLPTVPAGTATLTPALTNFDFNIPADANGQLVDFKLELIADGTSAEFAFDLIQVTGVAVPTLTTKAATAVTGSSAVLGGDITSDGGATLTERGVVYSSSNNTPTIGAAGVTQDINPATTTSFSETITGLTAGTTYYVRAYATNSTSTGYGNVQTFTTPTSVTSIVRASANPTNAATVQYTVTFGASVTGLTTSNFGLSPTVTGASISSVSGSGTTYTVTVNTGTGDGSLQLNLANTAGLTPGISNVLPVAGEIYTIDKTRPTVVISSTAGASGSTTATTPIPFTVTFSESVTNFIAGDLTVVNGTVSSFSGSGATYTFNVTPATPGTATTVNVVAGVAQDAAGNTNTAATQFSLTYNQPGTTVASVTRLTPSPTATAQVRYRVVFASSVSGITVGNFSVTPLTGSITGAGVSSASGSGTTYTVTVNTGTGDGTLRLNVANSTGITPTVTNVPYTAGEVYTITKSFAAAPQLTIQGTGGTGSDVTAFVDVVQVLSGGTAFNNALQNSSFEQYDPLANGDYGYQPTGASWTFNPQAGIAEDGSAFTPATPIPNGIAVAFVQSTSGNNGQLQQNLAVPTGSNYQISFRAAQRLCCTTLDQALNVFLNGVFLGNILPGSNGYDTFTSATFAVTAPALTATVSTTSASPTSTAPIPFSVSFSQSVGTSFTASDVTVTGGALTSGSFSGSGSGPYTFTVTPSGTGTVSVSLAANVTNDANNTGNTASNTVSVQYTQPVTAAPVVVAPANNSRQNTTTPTYGGTAPAGATIRVYVDGALLPVTATANSAGNWAITQPFASPLAQGSHTVYATAQLSGQAVSASSNTNTFIVDSVRPSVVISSTAGASGSATSTSPIPFTITFSESVTGFVQGDLTVTGGSVSGFAGSGTTYTFNVTPTATGTVQVNVPANVAQDAALNGNTAATQFSIQYNQPPTATPVVTTPANGSSVPTNQPTYSGTAPANSTVTVYVDGSSRGTTPADAGGNWTFTQPTALTTGSHTVYATAQLSGQAVSANSNTNTFTVLNPATYTSSTAAQPNTERLLPGSLNQEILRVAVVIGGGNDTPLSAQSFSFTTNGSTNPADIAAARLYYTGTSSTFAQTTQFGGAVASPNGSFTISGTQQLTTGTNYFFLVYDVAPNAQPGRLLDATIPSLTIGGTAYTPSTTSPAGNRRIVGSTRVPGLALDLTGGSTAGYVDFSADAANPAPVFTGAYTQEVWIKPAIGTGSVTYYVLGNGTGTAAAPYIAVTGNGRLEAGYGKGSTQGGSPFRFAQTGPNQIDANVWSHVVATFDGSALRLYLNGEQVATTTVPANEVPPATPVNYIGGAATSGANFFPGDIDEVSQWNRALSVTEIRQRRRLIRTGLETGLVSYLQFNDTGSTTTDGVGGSVGTLTGVASRATSTVPVGYGTSNLQVVSANGPVTFAGTNVLINFAGVSGSSDVVVSRLDGTPSGTQPALTGQQKIFVPAYWIIDEYGSLTFNNTTTATYSLSTNDISTDDQATPSNLKLFVRDGNSDQAFGTTLSASAASAAAGTVTYPLGSVANFGQTVIGTIGNSPLPVTLVSFAAERVGEDALLRWTTAQEKDNAYFEVESSADGRSFRPVGRLEGAGTRTTPRDYRLTDANLARYAAGTVYYRLRQVDLDGTAHLSDVVALTLSGAPVVTTEVFPNPATDQLTVRLRGLDAAKVQAQLYDAQGRLVYKFVAADRSGTDLRASVGHLPSGVYTLRLLLPGRVLHRPVVISH